MFDVLLCNVNSKVDCVWLLVLVCVECVYEVLYDGDEVVFVVIWCDVLNLECVGCGDYFFDFGGYLFVVVCVVMCVVEWFGCDVLVCVLFEVFVFV